MESKKRFICLTALLVVIGVGFLVAAIATDNWVIAKPVYLLKNKTNRTNNTDDFGKSTFGLFSGHQILNRAGTGQRESVLTVACQPSEGFCAYTFDPYGDKKNPQDLLRELITQFHNKTNREDKAINYGLFSFSLWVATIVLLSLSIVMGLVTIGFSIYNTFGRPIETITGPLGLYVWNGSSLLFTTATLAVFGALFQSELSVNFLDYTQISGGWRSNDTQLDFSYFFLLGAAISFILNLILLVVSGQSLSCSYSHSGEKEYLMTRLIEKLMWGVVNFCITLISAGIL